MRTTAKGSTLTRPERPPPPAGKILIGCAGWSLSRAQKEHFPKNGSHLERYAQVFPAVEINSSFYRPHRTATYARWAATVPADFRFSVKLPKTITHLARLADTREPLREFLAEVAGLGKKLGCLLVQLPPSLEFDPTVAREFFQVLRASTKAPAVIEPRHPTWFAAPAEALLRKFQIARAAADPPPVPAAASPGGRAALAYHRLHGSPRMYYSAYSPDFLADLGQELIKSSHSAQATWCIFDNTARDAALPNARLLLERIGRI